MVINDSDDKFKIYQFHTCSKITIWRVTENNNKDLHS